MRAPNPKDVLGLWDIDLALQDADFEKPIVCFVGVDTNVFALAGQVKVALIEAGRRDLGNEVWWRMFKCATYEEAMRLFAEYVIIADEYLVH